MESSLSNNSTTAVDTQSQDTLFVPFLGQSNGQHMSIIRPPYKPGSTSNSSSGATILKQELSESTNYNVVTSTSTDTNFAVGGSQANGNGGYQQEDSLVWWYPEENEPGGALIEAEQELEQWLSDNQAQSTDEIAIVWSQGEADVIGIDPNNPQTGEQYRQSTLAVFDYLKDTLEYENITFYIVPTGRLESEGASNSGFSDESIAKVNEGLVEVRTIQSEIAVERNDVHLAPDYSDLNTIYEEGEIYGDSYDVGYEQWSKDFWHLGNDGLKINGSRLAQYIALDRGQNNVISFTDSFGSPAQSTSLSRAGILDIDITENSNQDIIEGTDNPDIIVGSLSNDEITGGKGNDVIVGSRGVDTLTGGSGKDVFLYDSAIYPNVKGNGDFIDDFDPGKDRLDVSELLKLADYSGDDPLGDGYITVDSVSEDRVKVQFVDGGGNNSAATLAILDNIDAADFENDVNSQFIFTPTEF